MSRLSSFVALRYAGTAGDPADLIAPPYDVIDSDQAAALRARSTYNAVRLVLPEGTSDARYDGAADTLRAWIAEGVLVADRAPAVYVYRQRYTLQGEEAERLAVFGALELEPFGRGVLPHERTHSGPRADRLALTLATRTQLSPVFLLARDEEGTLLEALRGVAEDPPEFRATTPDGIEHSVWVTRNGQADALGELAARDPLLVADGHHRYETALEAARRLGGAAARRVLACIVSARDPGLVIRPTHRTLRALNTASSGDNASADLATRLARWFRTESLGNLDAAAAERAAATDPAGMVLFAGSPGREALRLSPRASTENAAAAHPGAAAADRIAAVRFDRHVMGDLLRLDADGAAHEGILEYHRDAATAVRRAGSGGAVFLLPPVSLDAVWEAAAAGIRLPPKSTYFEPKIPSGIVFRPL